MSYVITLHGIRDAVKIQPHGVGRVLTDRLWPRGLRKDELGDIQWYRDASPETALRKGFHDGTISTATFRQQYRAQLQRTPETLAPLVQLARQGELQLLTATHMPQDSYLTVLRQALLDALAAQA